MQQPYAQIFQTTYLCHLITTVIHHKLYPEVAKALLFCGRRCYGTLRKKAGLPAHFWAWKLGNGDVKENNDNLAVMRWNDVTKRKISKVSWYLFNNSQFKPVDSNKKFVKQEKLFINQTLALTTTAQWYG